MQKSVYDFTTLEDALVYFERLGYLAEEVKIAGAFGGSTPTEDDDPIFFADQVLDVSVDFVYEYIITSPLG